MKENQSPHELAKLFKQAEELVKSDPTAEQAVVVKTVKGNLLCFLNHDIASGSTKEEDDFVRVLAEKEDTEIRYAVCMWNDLTIDMMSLHLRESLVKLDSYNKETIVILKDAEGFLLKSLKTCLP